MCVCCVCYRGHSDGETWGLAANPDGTMAVTGGDDNKLCLWSLESQELLLSRTIADKADAKAAKYQRKHGARRSTMADSAPNQCCRAADWGVNGFVFVGTNDGRVMCLDETDLVGTHPRVPDARTHRG